MSAPLISVLLPVMNAGQVFLPQTLHSLIRQSFTTFEIIAVDCGSTDGSGLILETAAAADPRVRLFHRPGTSPAAALEEALQLSRGSLIALMPVGGQARSDRLACLHAAVEAGPAPALSGSWIRLIDADNEPLWIRRDLGADARLPLPASCLMHRALAETTSDWSGWLATYPQHLPLDREAAAAVTIIPEPLLDEPVTPSRPGLPGPAGDRARVYAAWSRRAAAAGQPRGARKYARRALLRAPWRRTAWAVAFRALTT
ncbi:MAG: glycosyltransferase family 2 protein [Opitutales bacterium]